MRVTRSNNRTSGRRDLRHSAAATSAASPSLARVRPATTAVPLALRLKVFMSRGKLDREIVAGRSYQPAAALELRARQLTSSRAQRRAADNLRGVVEYVDRLGSRPVFSAVVICRAAVSGGREPIFGLAERLEKAAPVTARGMVLARELLTDGSTSPLFSPASPRTVAQAIWNISDALGPEKPPG
jgi:hypothetical protein